MGGGGGCISKRYGGTSQFKNIFFVCVIQNWNTRHSFTRQHLFCFFSLAKRPPPPPHARSGKNNRPRSLSAPTPRSSANTATSGAQRNAKSNKCFRLNPTVYVTHRCFLFSVSTETEGDCELTTITQFAEVTFWY